MRSSFLVRPVRWRGPHFEYIPRSLDPDHDNYDGNSHRNGGEGYVSDQSVSPHEPEQGEHSKPTRTSERSATRLAQHEGADSRECSAGDTCPLPGPRGSVKKHK